MKRDIVTAAFCSSVFHDYFKESLQETKRNKTILSLALIDIDYFKKINDEFGHDAGDAVLKGVVENITRMVGERGKIFRHGGDDFIVLLPGIEKEEAFLMFEQIRKDVADVPYYAVNNGRIEKKITISIGIANFPDDGQLSQELIRKAKDANHRAKISGRNKVCLAKEERMVTKTSHYTQGQLQRLSLLAEMQGLGEAILLREALDDLLRKYQPK